MTIDQENTFEQQITVLMKEVTNSFKTGGSPITSYSLEWDSGTSGSTYTVLIGDATNNIVLSFT